MDSGDYTTAVDEYRKAIVLSPDDADTLAGISLALYTLGEDKKSKDMKQESLNYMDKFLRVAPKDHKLRDDIEGLANYIKTQEKLKPQKIN
jgi:tetratricopeptide (TPR) repeat protein